MNLTVFPFWTAFLYVDQNKAKASLGKEAFYFFMIQSCMFLGMHPLLLGDPLYWYILFKLVSHDPFISVASVVTSLSFLILFI